MEILIEMLYCLLVTMAVFVVFPIVVYAGLVHSERRERIHSLEDLLAEMDAHPDKMDFTTPIVSFVSAVSVVLDVVSDGIDTVWRRVRGRMLYAMMWAHDLYVDYLEWREYRSLSSKIKTFSVYRFRKRLIRLKEYSLLAELSRKLDTIYRERADLSQMAGGWTGKERQDGKPEQ